eukprot:TRINITY_DN12004_c1_g4_i3.p2 TRINITY_DN12004_c1_g4~~TRINITY_DN12004_c1_g4_i3.p2  ORF type:complete len:103 (-),score=6.43 TRINITY_DN12004_c1_g4_i3:141-449(-)
MELACVHRVKLTFALLNERWKLVVAPRPCLAADKQHDTCAAKPRRHSILPVCNQLKTKSFFGRIRSPSLKKNATQCRYYVAVCQLVVGCIDQQSENHTRPSF